MAKLHSWYTASQLHRFKTVNIQSFVYKYGHSIHQCAHYKTCTCVLFTCTTSFFFCIVSGEANFQMKRTALTAGGFTQPVVAKGLIEHAQSVEKGLVQRFLWISPKPSYSKFCM